MAGEVQFSIRDKGPDANVSIATFPGIDFTAANHDAEVTLQADLLSALQGINIGTVIKQRRIASEVLYPNNDPASPYAQRTTKWACRYHDSGDPNTTHYLEIPCADLSLIAEGTEDKMDLSAGAGATFKTAFEAYVVAPGGTRGNTVLDSVTYVSKRKSATS